ncbi:hypothetical protein POTOM_017973 [Populus tomentosa]|uniref:Protein kinase domain-containing protein n=1 Tax=Populus tomentosa TaxID=118781 RepID=A0A8X7ZVV0_POPTO|nr:hypothetical protein POTOM_017973 [Populus tomentosa]
MLITYQKVSKCILSIGSFFLHDVLKNKKGRRKTSERTREWLKASASKDFRKLHILASWGNRLRIASEITLAHDYLLSLADPPIVHGDVKSVSMLSDNNYTAKIADFGASPLISSGQTIISLWSFSQESCQTEMSAQEGN